MNDKHETVEAFERLRRREVGPDEDLDSWERELDPMIEIEASLERLEREVDEWERGLDLPIPTQGRTRVRWGLVAFWAGYLAAFTAGVILLWRWVS